MKPHDLIICMVLLSILQCPCYATSLIITSSSTDGTDLKLKSDYTLDTLSSLSNTVAFGGGDIFQHQYARGVGPNSISSSVGNSLQSISSEASSRSGLDARSSAHASGSYLGLSQLVGASGESRVGVESSSGTLSASQLAGVYEGALVSSQSASARDGSVAAYQASALEGLLGFTSGDSSTESESASTSGGLNGAGALVGRMATSASTRASARALLQADSEASTAYSTVEAISDEKDAYSYLSSAASLASAMAADTGDGPRADQALEASRSVLAYASSSDGTSTEKFAGESDSITGTIKAQSGSVEDDLSGEVTDVSANLRPTPGHTVWNGFGGYIISDPSLIKDNQGRLHAFVQGGNTALFDNINGNWYGLGGALTSDPFAIKDQQGRIHTFARNWDGSLVDSVFDTGAFSQYWQNLGGYITSDPSAALEPVPNGFLKIVVKGGDNALWMRDLDTRSMSGVWNYLGGIITSDPYVTFDAQKNIHTLARGADGAIWDNHGVWNGAVYVQTWHYRGGGGTITSDARPIQDPNNGNIIHVFARNSDGQLSDTRLNTALGTYDRVLLGGFISPEGSVNNIYEGNPEPLADANRLIHNFVRGGDGSLWDNVYDTSVGTAAWYPMGGYITSDASATLDASNLIRVGARGGDGSLWINTVF